LTDPKKLPASFYATSSGSEPVRDWLLLAYWNALVSVARQWALGNSFEYQQWANRAGDIHLDEGAHGFVAWVR